jgi:exodeoxyribonuclease-3
VFPKGLADFIASADPDVLCLQETKCETAVASTLGLAYPHQFWHEAEKKGYSGTAVLSKTAPLSVATDFPGDHPPEGRVVTAEFNGLFVVSAYVPNSQRELERLDYRLQWDADFRKYLARLAKKKPVVVCGDLNVAHTEHDLANPKTNRRNAGFTDEERAEFQALVEAGFVDTFRLFTQGNGHYTWWSYMNGARPRNIGWRIDYFLVSAELVPRVKSARILPHVPGSDHCPVVLELR